VLFAFRFLFRAPLPWAPILFADWSVAIPGPTSILSTTGKIRGWRGAFWQPAPHRVCHNRNLNQRNLTKCRTQTHTSGRSTIGCNSVCRSPRHITQPPSIWHPRRLKPQLRLRTRSEMSQHLYLAISALRDAFALGVLTGFYGKKLHGAIVEVAFFKPNLYAHLPAVSFVD